MLNLSDKELDRLSREAAEKYEVGHDPDEWPKLEQMLDRELGRSSPIPKLPGPRIRFLYAPALLLLIGTAYFILKTSKNTSTSTQKNPTQQNQAAKETVAAPVVAPAGPSVSKAVNGPDNADPASKISSSNIPAEVSSAPNKTGASSSGNIAKKEFGKTPVSTFRGDHSIADAKDVGRGNKKVGHEFHASAGMRQTLKTEIENKVEDNKNSNTSSPDIRNHKDLYTKETAARIEKSTGGPVYKIGAPGNGHSKNADLSSIPDPQLVATAGLQPIALYDPFIINDALLPNLHSNRGASVNSPAPPIQQQKNRMLHTNRSLQFGLVYAPDFSEVRYNYNNKIGRNIGITVSYEFPGRLSINSGLIASKKNYDASAYDFHLPANCGISQDNLDFAVCTSNIYEIPLNLRYDIDRSGNDAFFVSGGFSSYIMGKENFKFYLHDNNIGYRRWESATYQTGQIFWFSVLNISAGFERKISNSFSFQAEPFIKLPLTGIGFGNVNLSSYGINVSIKYAPLLKRSRH